MKLVITHSKWDSPDHFEALGFEDNVPNMVIRFDFTVENGWKKWSHGGWLPINLNEVPSDVMARHDASAPETGNGKSRVPKDVYSLKPGSDSETRTQPTHKEIFLLPNWTDWSNTNQNGSEFGPIFCPYPCSALIVSEQVGHGIVNVKLGFLYPDGSEGWTGWITENMGGIERQPIRCPAGTFATGIKVREQSAKGLVNMRLTDSNGSDSPWATDNQAGNENDALKIPQGNAITGISTREQAGYEIVNVKVHFQPS